MTEEEPQAIGMLQTPHDVMREADYEVKGAVNEKVNGGILFKYPNYFEELQIQIGVTRRCGDVKYDDLTTEGKIRVLALATLEQVIIKAPLGWYYNQEGKPLLAPGLIGDGDDLEVVKAYRDGYIPWAENFRKAKQTGKLQGDVD